jgi:hypothetical protein
MLARFRKWLIFRVLLALLPIGFNVLLALAFGPPLTRSYLFGGGELLLLAVGLSGAALGDALVMRRQREAMRDALVGACFFNLGLAAFAVVSVGNALKQEVGYSMVVSFVLYGGAVITSGICATLAER